MPRVWMTKREIAAYLGVSVSTVERVKPPFMRVGGQNRYDPVEVERFLRAGVVRVDRPDNVVELRPRKGAA